MLRTRENKVSDGDGIKSYLLISINIEIWENY